MVIKKDLPKQGEILTAVITSIRPNSAFAKLEGYDKEGMIHISEVANGWVRDIRKHVKPGQKVAVKVTRVDPIRGYISLSIKAVGESQKSAAFKEKHLEKRAEKMLEMAASSIGKSLKEAQDEIGQLAIDKFGSLYGAFEAAIKKPEKLEKAGLPESWIEAIKKISEKTISQKEFEFRASVEMQSLEGNGIDKIKKILEAVEGKHVKVSYISAPKYLAHYSAKDAKKAEKSFTNILEDAQKQAKDSGVRMEFKIESQ